MMEPNPTRRPFPLGRRALVILAVGAAGVWAYLELGLSPAQLVPATEGARRVVGEFFFRALTPALAYEGDAVPEGTTPLPLKAMEAAWKTVLFAAAAMSLSVLLGIFLGFPASSAWWAGDPVGGGRFRRATAPLVYGGARALIAVMRSVHELLWAILFLAAFGFSTFSAVVAIAIPYGGTLAKIFSEMIDEAPRGSALALRAAGASPSVVFTFGLLPRALPDMFAYAFYRFECAVRASAILGFFGYETLGYYIRASFENLHFGEVWTYLYTLFFLVIVLEIWSGALRRRFFAHE